MAELFDAIMAGGYFQPFGNLTPAQLDCKAFTSKHLDELLRARQREKYIKDVRVCVCGFSPADEDEPMDENNFSQFQFFAPYTNDLVFYVDKFDFIAKCVAHGVCKVHAGFEDRYLGALLAALTFKHYYVPEHPEQVLDLRQLETPRIVPEQCRSPEKQRDALDSYLHRRRSFANSVRQELEALESEQLEAEKRRGERRSMMGWEEQDREMDDERRAAFKRQEGGNTAAPEGAASDVASAQPTGTAAPVDGDNDSRPT